MRELTEIETEEVAGGPFFIPLAIAGFQAGFAAVSGNALIAAGAAGAAAGVAAVTIAFTADQRR